MSSLTAFEPPQLVRPEVPTLLPLDRAVAALSWIPGRLWWRAAWGSVLGVVVAILAAGAIVVAYFELVGRRDLSILGGALTIIAEALPLLIALHYARPIRDAVHGWGQSLGWTRPTMGDARSGALWALANLGVRTAVVAVTVAIVPAHIRNEANNTTDLHHTSVLALILVAIGGVIVAPIAEETVFRGVVLRAGMRRWSFARSALISSLIFGAFHSYEAASAAGAAVLVVNITAFGLVQCLAARRTGHLAPCAISHGLVNGLALLLVATT